MAKSIKAPTITYEPWSVTPVVTLGTGAMAMGDKEAVDATNSVEAENSGETLAWDLPKLGIWHSSAYNASCKTYG
uniref:Uncharacterized protein n=1 Tax=Romanomermis culicivorax TaxID=13658 RepID=A0A915IJA7_ROMCU